MCVFCTVANGRAVQLWCNSIAFVDSDSSFGRMDADDESIERRANNSLITLAKAQKDVEGLFVGWIESAKGPSYTTRCTRN
jgi:hypothetical protein